MSRLSGTCTYAGGGASFTPTVARRWGVWRRLAGGRHCARDTLSAIEAAGFAVERVRQLDISPSSGITNPHVLGIARAPLGRDQLPARR
jgi:hypothetical protein